MAASLGVPSAPAGLRNTAGGIGQVSTFSPDWSSGEGDLGFGGGFGGMGSLGGGPKLGSGMSSILEEQMAKANKMRDPNYQASIRKMPGSFAGKSVSEKEALSTFDQDHPESYIPPSDTSAGLGYDPMTGLGFDPSKSPAGYNPDLTRKDIDYYQEALGVDPGLEQYEADFQKRYDPARFGPGTFNTDPGWMADYSLAMQLQGPNKDSILHSLTGGSWNDPVTGEFHMGIDPRDPSGFGSDYAKSRGRDVYNAEVKNYLNLWESDPDNQYFQMYGKLPVGDPVAFESWFRRANSGGNYIRGRQDMAAQNARTDLTEGLIMSALAAGMGGLAGAASIGYGGTYGASGGLGSTLGSQLTADALARQAISGMGQYGS